MNFTNSDEKRKFFSKTFCGSSRVAADFLAESCHLYMPTIMMGIPEGLLATQDEREFIVVCLTLLCASHHRLHCAVHLPRSSNSGAVQQKRRSSKQEEQQQQEYKVQPVVGKFPSLFRVLREYSLICRASPASRSRRRARPKVSSLNFKRNL